METQATSPRRGLRFSLWTVFVVLTIVTLAISHLATSKRVSTLEAENARLRRETGALAIKHGTEDQLHIIAVPTKDELTWEWRLHVPKGNSVRLNTADGVPAVTTSKQSGGHATISLESGEHVVAVSLQKTRRGHWTDAGGARATIGTHDSIREWVEADTLATSWSQAGADKQEMAERGKPFDLLRFEVSGAPGRAPSSAPPIDGLHVWISGAP